MPVQDWTYGDPCPECGESEHFGETCEAQGIVYFDDNGNVDDFKVNHMGEPLIVKCLECDTELMNRLD